ncbi:MAG: AAA family ATPase [Eubacterium sp.]|nr:AAA family ATPase [Eubacterium sp.]
MIYYKIKCKYTLEEEKDEKRLKRLWEDINNDYEYGEHAMKLYIYENKDQVFSALLAFSMKDNTLSSVKKYILNDLVSSHELIKSVSFVGTPEEITVEKAIGLVYKGMRSGYGRGAKRNAADYCNAVYAHDKDVQFEEHVLPHAHLTYSEAIDEAHSILADDSLYEELERIYSPLNKHKFYGNPVHYKINAVSRETAKRIVNLLTKALYSNQRLLSTRVTYVTDTDYDSFDCDLNDLCSNSYASIVAIECDDKNSDSDGYARGLEKECETIRETVNEYATQTMFVLVDLGSKVCKQVVQQLIHKDEMNFIEMYEGKGDKKAGKDYLTSLLKENKVPYAKADFVLPEQKDYTVSDIVAVYKDIKKNSIKNSIYKAYKEAKTIDVDAPKSLSSSYDKLQSMVGLTEIKSIIDQIISAQKINKLRRNMGLDVTGTAKHMIFTGNPGSAKTTVARLLASILYDEHVLESNKFIECGRQDLVGKYVGWTAKLVEEQFRRAKGGILFIDEAYSLVEKGGYYGDEAINTIVQMMENYRDDVIVIFAGYPDKMKKFLEKNEGLRSRIAFHIDFPDYNGEELCDILKLMIKDKGYTLEEDAEDKCRNIFEVASHNAEFGNGRFVRNVLEQAIIKQSARIVNEFKGEKVDEKVISILSASDFDINAAATYKSPKVAIGF